MTTTTRIHAVPPERLRDARRWAGQSKSGLLHWEQPALLLSEETFTAFYDNKLPPERRAEIEAIIDQWANDRLNWCDPDHDALYNWVVSLPAFELWADDGGYCPPNYEEIHAALASLPLLDVALSDRLIALLAPVVVWRVDELSEWLREHQGKHLAIDVW